MKHKIALILTLVVLGLTVSANAQNRTLGKGETWKQRIEDIRSGKIKIDNETATRADAGDKKGETNDAVPALANPTGTWFVTVPGPTPADNFYAYWTFGNDGTFVETSSLLVTLTEGPAHGAYERSGRGYNLTFELFAFDPEAGVAVGRIRVRCAFRMTTQDTLVGDAFAEFIEADGTIIPLGGGPLSAERVQVRGL